MVPAYLERIERLPLTTTGKIDRRGLPPPSGPRRLGRQRPAHAAADRAGGADGGDPGHVLRVDRVSVQSDFFDDLGADSLLMADFNAHLRRRDVPVS